MIKAKIKPENFVVEEIADILFKKDRIFVTIQRNGW